MGLPALCHPPAHPLCPSDKMRTAAAGARIAVLASLNCDLLQGYYVSRPLSPHSLERWVSLQPPAE